MNQGNGLIIFGGTGDLTRRKLIPAIYNLFSHNLLNNAFFVVSVGRRSKTKDEYRKDLLEALKEYSRNEINGIILNELMQHIYYYKLDFNNDDQYSGLNRFIEDLENKYNTERNRLFYLAVSPDYFGIISENLKKYNLANNEEGYKRVVIEKPFGKDLQSAEKLNRQIVSVFSEKNVYRVDHYLGKEMLQNIMVIRFSNVLFEPVWNSRFIDNIQITSSETLGVNERGEYYDKTGALKDMVQNHLLQFLALIAMEPPDSLSTEDIRDKKVQLLREIKKYSKNEVRYNAVRGQYGENQNGDIAGYRQEIRIDNNSNTETYVALKIEIDNKRWQGVPFYLRTGKRMNKKSTQAVITFKRPDSKLYKQETEQILPNQLVIGIQPKEGVSVKFNAKKPGIFKDVIPVKMDFCQSCQIERNSLQAYEKLLLDAITGDKTLFTRWDEVSSSWKFIDSIYNVWENEKPDFPNYEAGSYGPEISEELLKRNGHIWYNKGVDNEDI